MSGLAKRITVTFGIVIAILAFGLLFTYQVLPINWVSFMEIQPSYRPMENPLPVPPFSVPVEGAAYVPGSGSPANPISQNQESIARGQVLYEVHCALCHGKQGKADGPIATELARKPPDLSAGSTVALSDGDIFLVITNGIQVPVSTQGGMPALRENLSVADRWDVVNYVRSYQK
jgi:mono/diheme cytochrome c family protein